MNIIQLFMIGGSTQRMKAESFRFAGSGESGVENGFWGSRGRVYLNLKPDKGLGFRAVA